MAKKAQLKNKLQESGTSSLCMRRLIMWTTNSSRTDSGDARCYSTRIPFSLTSRSNPFTSTIPGAELPDKVIEGNSVWVLQSVLSRAFFASTSTQRPEKHLQFCPYIFARSTPGKWYWEKAHLHDSCRDAWRTCGVGCG